MIWPVGAATGRFRHVVHRRYQRSEILDEKLSAKKHNSQHIDSAFRILGLMRMTFVCTHPISRFRPTSQYGCKIWSYALLGSCQINPAGHRSHGPTPRRFLVYVPRPNRFRHLRRQPVAGHTPKVAFLAALRGTAPLCVLGGHRRLPFALLFRRVHFVSGRSHPKPPAGLVWQLQYITSMCSLRGPRRSNNPLTQPCHCTC